MNPRLSREIRIKIIKNTDDDVFNFKRLTTKLNGEMTSKMKSPKSILMRR